MVSGFMEATSVIGGAKIIIKASLISCIAERSGSGEECTIKLENNAKDYYEVQDSYGALILKLAVALAE